MRYLYAAILLALVPYTLAVPAPEARDAPPHPMITPKAALVDRIPTRVVERDLTSVASSLLSEAGSAIPSYVSSGVPNFFQNFPTGDSVLSSVGISSSDLAAAPTMVLNLP
jgi:hypothetical protein